VFAEYIFYPLYRQQSNNQRFSFSIGFPFYKGHTFDTSWNDLQLAYFAGTAMWTYMNTPFFLARPGVESEEIEPWQEAGETWRRLKVRFPADIASHSTEQTFYFDQQGLLKHDCDVEIAGGTPAAHYVSDLKEFFGMAIRRSTGPFLANRMAIPCPNR
jgi:hypothetical protein